MKLECLRDDDDEESISVNCTYQQRELLIRVDEGNDFRLERKQMRNLLNIIVIRGYF